MAWKNIDTAPKDGTEIIIRSVSGTDDTDILFEGVANWRSEHKPAMYDPISGECYSKAGKMTGWIGKPYLVPGKPCLWKQTNPDG